MKKSSRFFVFAWFLLISKSNSVKFSLIESVICLFTDSSVKKYFSLSNQSIYSNLFLAIWISQISLIISRFRLIQIYRVCKSHGKSQGPFLVDKYWPIWLKLSVLSFFGHTKKFRQWEQLNYKNQNYAINEDHPNIDVWKIKKIEIWTG